MSDRTRVFFISLSILALVMFSAFGTIPVYADDGTTSGSTETTTTTGATEQPASDPSTVSEQQPPADSTTPAAETPPDAAIVPLLEQVPDNVTVTVVDATGEAQPLVSQDSADAVLLSDPIWCPTGQAPTPGANGCTASYGSFTELLDFLKAKELEGNTAYLKDGTIYVEQGAYAGGETSINFDTYNFTELNKKNLTVTGGWNPADNSTDSTSNFTVPIIIGSSNPWGGSLTLNNIIINGVTNQTGLTLNSKGNIELSNIEVTNSQNGAELTADGNVTIKNSKFHKNNQKGADITSKKGTVTVSNSQFSDNGSGDIGDPTGSGLGVNSYSTVTLMDVTANNNQLFGSDIQAGGAVSITKSFFSGNQGIIYAYNWDYKGYGLQVVTTGDISLSDVVANDNYLFGASLDGAKVTIGEKELLTKSTFNNNGPSHENTGNGLTVVGSGVVSIYNIEANNNNMYGATIDGKSSVVIFNSLFNGNQSYTWSGAKTYFGYGLQVVTPADVGVHKVSANDNNVLGAHLQGSDVIVSNSSFSNNGSASGMDLLGKGLEIVGTKDNNFGKGDVSLTGITADSNELFGADIQTTGNVAIFGSSFSGQMDYVYDYDIPTGNGSTNINGGYGLKVVALTGKIALGDVVTTGNFLYGTSLEGTKVDIANSVFSSNGSTIMTYPVGFGLKVVSTDPLGVTLTDVVANNNQLYGADIKAVGDITISASTDKFSTFTANQSVFIKTGVLDFKGYGLTAYSESGDITLNRVEANFNNLWGGSLDGLSIFVTNSKFNNNISDSTLFIDDTGLLVNSRGTMVFLNYVEAKNNRLIGVTIKDDLTTSDVADVYIRNSTFTGNAGFTCTKVWCPQDSLIYHGEGLDVVTAGLISLDNVNASDNTLFGAYLQGSTVTVANSTFSNNKFQNGLTISSSGVVTLTNVTASNNGLNGVEVTSASPCVFVGGGTFTGNAQYGIAVNSIAGLQLDGTQIFGGNGAGDVFPNPPNTCLLVVLSVASAPLTTSSVVVTTNNTSTTLSAGITTNTKVTTATKTTKAKKAVVKKHKLVKVRRHARWAR